MELTTKAKMKLGATAIIALLVIIFIALNFTEVDVHLIAIKFKTSLAFLIIGVLATGFLLGWLVGSFFRKKPKPKK